MLHSLTVTCNIVIVLNNEYDIQFTITVGMSKVKDVQKDINRKVHVNYHDL